MRKLILIGGAAVALGAAAAIGTGTAAALIPTATGIPAPEAGSQAPGAGSQAPDTPDVPLTGSDLEKAVQSALTHTGGGSVTETETGDDGAAYGVEIRKPDGHHVEVNLDSSFVVVGEEADDNDDD